MEHSSTGRRCGGLGLGFVPVRKRSQQDLRAHTGDESYCQPLCGISTKSIACARTRTYGMRGARCCPHIETCSKGDNRKDDSKKLSSHVKWEPPPSFAQGSTVSWNENTQREKEQGRYRTADGMCDKDSGNRCWKGRRGYTGTCRGRCTGSRRHGRGGVGGGIVVRHCGVCYEKPMLGRMLESPVYLLYISYALAHISKSTARLEGGVGAMAQRNSSKTILDGAVSDAIDPRNRANA